MDGLLIAARTLHFAAVITLTGVFAFECLVAGPALRQSGAAPASAARLRRHLTWLEWVSLVLAIGSGAVWLIAVAANMSGKPVGIALRQDVVSVVLTRTRFGEDWLLRLALGGLLGSGLLARRGLRRADGTIGWAALLVASLLLASLAWAGHGAATPGSPGDLHLAADILHLLGAGFWLGTLPPLALLLTEARRTRDPRWGAVVRRAIRRYSILAMASVAVLLVGGGVNTWFLAGTVPALVGTEYGRLLLVKIALFIATLIVAAVNLLRLTPRLAAGFDGARNLIWRTVSQLRRNSLIEVSFGFCVLAIVGVLGTLPPGLHTEPGWPLPFRVDLDALTTPSLIFLVILGVFAIGCAIGAVAAAAAGHYRRMAAFAAALVFSFVVGWIPLRPAVEPAYPTSFYARGEPYAAPSVARGAALFAENCALCHGVTGRGDGPATASLPARPADLTAPHLFAHTEGDLFWWVSHGTANRAMPGFAEVMSVKARWDVINFIRARAAGVLARSIGPEIAAVAAPPVPDFAFETDGVQQTLRQELETGPVLLLLFASPAPTARLRQLAAARPQFEAARLNVVAAEIAITQQETTESGPVLPPDVVDISSEVISTLALFRAPADGGETELMLDRAGNIRARWTAAGRQGLPDADTLVADAVRVGRLGVTAQSHTSHTH
jgi:putative copper export protein/mono/diheme cytochrome c family protein